MKKTAKILILSLIATIAVCLVFAFTACGGGGNGGTNGTYYLYENGKFDKSQYITLDGGKWSDDDDANGTYELNGTAIVFYAEVFGSNEEMFSGTLSDGALKVKVFGATMTYYKEGSEPSGDTPIGGNNTTEQYTITYDANGGAFANGGTTETQKANAGNTLTAPNSPVKTGAAFAGWATDKNGKTLWKFASDTVSGNLTLYAVWQEQSAVIISLDGATIDENKMTVFMLVDSDADSVSLSNKIVCSSDSVWKLYYDKLGQTEIPTKIAAGKSGALNVGDNVFYIVVTSSNGAQVNVYELTIHRSYAVSVNYFDNKNNLIETKTVYTGKEFSATYTPSISGYSFLGWKDKDGKAFTSDVIWHSLSLYADCTANTYTATLDVNGGDSLSKSEYTATYDKSYTLAVPTRTGYSFVGWYDGNNQITNSKGASISNWTFTNKKTFKAKWSANAYKVTLNKDLSDGGTVSGDGEHNYDSNVTIKATTNSGYTWLGWYDKDGNLVTDSTSYTFKMGFAVSYTAKWIKVNLATSDNNAGTVTSLTGTYIFGDKVTVTASTNMGYTFIGWYNGEKELTKDLTYTFTMPSENVTYTAKWEALSELSNFIFTSTSSKLNITGVKDKTVTEIIVPDYVTSISAGAFSGCNNLTNVTMPFVAETSYSIYFGYVFGADSYRNNNKYVPLSLKTVIITGGKIYSNAFYGCSGLTSVTIGNGVTSIGDSAFAGCSSLTSVTIPNSVTSIGKYAFSGCSSLESIYWNATNCTEAGLYSGSYYYPIFKNCTKLVKVEFGNNVKTIPAYAFGNCSSLTSVTIGNSVTSIGKYALSGCSSLTSITIPDSVTSIGDYAFASCSGLTSVTIPDSVTSIGEGAFAHCSGLTSITIPFVGGSVKTSKDTYQFPFGYIFGESSYSEYDEICHQSYYGSSTSSTTSTTYYIPSSLKNVTVTGGMILYGAFSGCKGLTSVTIPDSVTSIGNIAFSGCKGLTSITIPNSVTSIGSSAFSNCSGLTSITIGDGVTSIGSFAFQNSSSLKSVTIGNSVTSIGDYAFSFCSGLTSVTIGNGVTAIGWAAFDGCSSLTSITIGSGVTSIGDYAFASCSGLTSITIPDSVTSIGDYAFSFCSGLTSITIPDSVTFIGNYAFYNCSSLTSVTIGSGVTSIGERAFYNCSSLTSVIFKNTSGWRVSTSWPTTSETTILASSLSNPAKAATSLTSTYCSYNWKRS